MKREPVPGVISSTRRKPSVSDIRIEERETLVSTPRVKVERLVLSRQKGAGRENVERIIHDHGNGAAVLPYDPDAKTVLLTRQLRFPVFVAGEDGFLVEPCAGLVDDGETPEDGIRREAMEEIGTRLSALEKIAEVYVSPGFVTEKITLFLAEYSPADRIADGGGLDEEHEHIEVLEWPLATLKAAFDAGGIHDAKLMILTQALMTRRPELFG